MTNEEKAKAYDEALEDMKVIYPNLKGDIKLAVEHAFPELQESEDERIRVRLTEVVLDIAGGWPFEKYGITKKEALAYLEKQKEQKPAERVEINKSLSDAVITELGKYNGENYWKSPWAIDSTGLQYPLYFANLGATWQKEQKPVELSEEDKTIIDCAVEVVEKAGLPSLAASLKSLKSNWKPSEEQIVALARATNRCVGVDDAKILVKLLEQLEKL